MVTFQQALASASINGQVVFLGNIHGTFALDERSFSSILRRELTIYGTWNSKIEPRGADEWTRVLVAIDRAVHVTPLVSHTPRLEDAAQTLAAMRHGDGWFNKVVVQVDDSLESEIRA